MHSNYLICSHNMIFAFVTVISYILFNLHYLFIKQVFAESCPQLRNVYWKELLKNVKVAFIHNSRGGFLVMGCQVSNLCWLFIKQTFLGSRDGAMVRVLAFDQCGLGSIPARYHMWVEIVVGFRPAPRVCWGYSSLIPPSC